MESMSATVLKFIRMGNRLKMDSRIQRLVKSSRGLGWSIGKMDRSRR
jgi:hypothetical protein